MSRNWGMRPDRTRWSNAARAVAAGGGSRSSIGATGRVPAGTVTGGRSANQRARSASSPSAT
ncbi:hypothetical protein QLR68_17045 [Micromonospora sp. DH15]|nr:hypothetical protein [Micromonospora sp. DH15]